LVFGIEGKRGQELEQVDERLPHEKEGHHHGSHEQEVDVLNVGLVKDGEAGTLDWKWWETNVLEAAQKDEVFRIKGWGLTKGDDGKNKRRVLNWAFGRWKVIEVEDEATPEEGLAGKFTFVLARGE